MKPGMSSSGGRATRCRSRRRSRRSSTRSSASSTSRARVRGAGLGEPTTHVHARRAARPRVLDGVALLARAAGAHRPAAARVPARRGRLPDGLRRRGGAPRAAARARAGARRRRGARRLAHVDPSLRLAARGGARAARRRSRRSRASSRRRSAHGLAVHRGLVRELGVEPAADFPAYMDLEPFTVPPLPLPERAGRALRRRARGVQEHRRARGGVAARRAARPGGGAAPRRQGHAGPTSPRRSSASAASAGTRALAAGGRRAQWTTPGVLVLPSRSEGMGRVLVEAFCRGRGVVGTRAGSIPISSRTASRACSSSPATRARSPTRSCACCPTVRWPSGSAGARARRQRRGCRRPRSTRSGMRELVA